MDTLRETVRENLDERLLRITLSGRRHGNLPDRVKIRPVRLKGRLCFQAAVSDGKKEFHTNYEKEALLAQIEAWLREDYKQLQMDTTKQRLQALVNRKGQAVMHIKKLDGPCAVEAPEHNRKKQYLLEEGRPVPFLLDLGVMTAEGRIVHAQYHKFRQINRFLELSAISCRFFRRGGRCASLILAAGNPT